MRVADLDPNLVRACGALAGAVFAALVVQAVDRLPRRYGITHVAEPKARARRNVVLLVVSALLGLWFAHTATTQIPDDTIESGAFTVLVNLALACVTVGAAAIDIEHMILPNELTLGASVVCLATAPWRSLGLRLAIIGAVSGLVLAWLPAIVFRKLRGKSGMGLGDAKLALMAGTWVGTEGVIFVLFAGALQSVVAAYVMRKLGIRYAVPASVKAEISALRARADAGDEDARAELADDPMANEEQQGVLGTRLPLGPFLALALLEFVIAKSLRMNLTMMLLRR